MKFPKIKISFWRVLTLALILFLTGYLIYQLNPQSYEAKPRKIPPLAQTVETTQTIEEENCVTKTEEHIVRGDSLSGIIESGQTIKVLVGYYQCHEIQRGDIVIYNYAGSADPLIKIVKAVEGDSFKLQQSAEGWNILINGEIAKNSRGEPYVFNEQGYRMLSLYENDYQGVIPIDAVLLLGNTASGSLDSTRFGLVGKNDILGKVIR